MGVTAELGNEYLRLESPNERRHDGVKRPQPTRRSAVWGGSATLTTVPSARRRPELSREAGAGERGVATLVQADRQHPGIVVESRLHAVAVVRVDVDVGHPAHAVGEQPRDGDGRIVVDAEARGLRRHRVVQAARQVDGVHRLSACEPPWRHPPCRR